MTALHYLSLGEVAQRIRAGELTSLQVTRACLERIAIHEPRLNSYAMVLGEQALARAVELDRQQRAGAALGALHGVPIAIKDLLSTRGLPTASGTLVMRDFVPERDASVVTLLQEAGAVLVGKTQLTEGAFGTHHPQIVAPRNPWHRDYWTGVSSSGSAVAVAAGLAYGALGSDTGGSIRFPSACCGLVGIKPTYGRVSRAGAFPLAESLDHVGPMTRTVADAALLLGVIAGQDPADPTTLAEPVPDYLAALAEPVAGLAIGVDWRYVSRGVDAAVVETVRDAVAGFAALGATVTEVDMPASTERLVRGWGVTCAVECARAHADYYPRRRAEYGPVLADLIDSGLAATPADYQALEEVRARFRADLDGLLETVDMLVMPCMPLSTPTLADMARRPSSSGEQAEFVTFTAPFDYSGHPTITLPAGLTERRVPRAFQLVGRHLDEATLIRAGAAWERAAGDAVHPPL